MAKKAHITSIPGVAVEDRTLGLCGKEWKVKVLWDDIPRDYPICRDCVDIALEAMTQADEIIERSRRLAGSMQVRLSVLDDALNPGLRMLDLIADAAADFTATREVKARNKEARRKAAVTCTCEWDGRSAIVKADVNCPMHGAYEESPLVGPDFDPPPVAP